MGPKELKKESDEMQELTVDEMCAYVTGLAMMRGELSLETLAFAMTRKLIPQKKDGQLIHLSLDD